MTVVNFTDPNFIPASHLSWTVYSLFGILYVALYVHVLMLFPSAACGGPGAAADRLGVCLDVAPELQQALAELRELARGIHPAVLTDQGLDAAVRTLASRAPLPVVVESDGERLPAHVETAAYFVVAEALTNIAKYAHASRAHVTVARENGNAIIDVQDDGLGGRPAKQRLRAHRAR